MQKFYVDRETQSPACANIPFLVSQAEIPTIWWLSIAAKSTIAVSFPPASLAESESSITDWSWKEKFSLRLTFKSIMDFSSLYQVTPSFHVLVLYLQMGIKITSFYLTFYWSFLFKYESVIQGPDPSAHMSTADHSGTSLWSMASAVPCSVCAVFSWGFSAAGGMGSFLSQSKLQVGESVSCSEFQVVTAKCRITFS